MVLLSYTMKKRALLMLMYEKGTLCSTSIIEPNMFAHNTLLAKLMDGKVLAATLTDVCSFVTLNLLVTPRPPKQRRN